jgi:hypothetical protein
MSLATSCDVDDRGPGPWIRPRALLTEAHAILALQYKIFALLKRFNREVLDKEKDSKAEKLFALLREKL